MGDGQAAQQIISPLQEPHKYVKSSGVFREKRAYKPGHPFIVIFFGELFRVLHWKTMGVQNYPRDRCDVYTFAILNEDEGQYKAPRRHPAIISVFQRLSGPLLVWNSSATK
jgi:hypothetical protein